MGGTIKLNFQMCYMNKLSEPKKKIFKIKMGILKKSND